MVRKLFVLAFFVFRILESLIFFDRMIKVDAQIFEKARTVENGDNFLKGETLELIYNLINEDALDNFFENDIDIVVNEVAFLFDLVFFVCFF